MQFINIKDLILSNIVNLTALTRHWWRQQFLQSCFSWFNFLDWRIEL